MAFTNIGAAAAFVQAASILPRGDYNVATGAWVQGLNAGLGAPVQQLLQQQRSAFNHLKIVDARLTGREAGAGGDATDGSVGSSGILVTAVAAANQHGIPTNFGPGRGNWTLDDAARLWVSIHEQAASAADVVADFNVGTDDGGGIFPKTDLFAMTFVPGANPLFGDYVLSFKNRSRGYSNGALVPTLSEIDIHILYVHSDNL